MTEHAWWKDEVQTSRILFYLRVIPTCIECLPVPVFRKVVAPIMSLYPTYITSIYEGVGIFVWLNFGSLISIRLDILDILMEK